MKAHGWAQPWAFRRDYRFTVPFSSMSRTALYTGLAVY
jgi:hypothetical protein